MMIRLRELLVPHAVKKYKSIKDTANVQTGTMLIFDTRIPENIHILIMSS